MRISRLSWAGIRIELSGARLLLDAFSDIASVRSYLGKPRMPVVLAADHGSIDFALVTHLHPDHYDPTTLRQSLTPTGRVVCDRRVAGKIEKDGLPVMAVDLEQPIPLGPARVVAVPAVDGFGYDQVSWVVEAEGKKIIHCGDTLWHGYWWQIRRQHGPFDVAFLPINGAVAQFAGMQASGIPACMTPREAAAAGALLGARLLCPIHYGMFDSPPLYAEHPDAEQTFLKEVSGRGLRAHVVAPSSSVPFQEIDAGGDAD